MFSKASTSKFLNGNRTSCDDSVRSYLKGLIFISKTTPNFSDRCICVVRLILVSVFVFIDTNQVLALRCFHCTNYISPALCTHVTTCTQDQDSSILKAFVDDKLDMDKLASLQKKPGEECYVEEFVTDNGRVLFNSGCRSKSWCPSNLLEKRSSWLRSTDITVCMGCCQGNLCNNQGCGKNAIPRDQRGPYCYTCDYMTRPNDCDRVKICAANEKCALFGARESLVLHTQLYTADCKDDKTCQTLSHIDVHGPCPATCCNADFCNTACDNSTQTVTPQTTAQSNKSTPHTMAQRNNTSPHTMVQSNQSTSQTSISVSNGSTNTVTSKTTISVMAKPLTKINHVNNSNLTTISTTTYSLTPLSSTTITMSTTAQPICGDDDYLILPHSNLCIRLDKHAKEWNNARHACLAENADLVILDTKQKIEAMKKYLDDKHDHYHYWIGAIDRDHNDIFVWVNHQLVTESNWALHEPDRSSDNCAYINSKIHHQWSGASCSGRHYFICERK